MYRTIEGSYLGFTDGIKEPRKTKVENLLDDLIRHNGGIYNMVSFLVGGLLEGRTIEKEEGAWHYKKNGEKTKPRTVYKFISVNKKTYMELKKTEYDFCQYCIDRNLVTDEAVDGYLVKENEAKADRERLEMERQREAEEKTRKKEEEKQCVESILMETMANIPDEEKELMGMIFENVLGYADKARLNYRLLALIHNYDIPLCKTEIISWLHNDNKASIKTFECVTGLNLPKTYKERRAYLESISSADFTGIKEYKPRKKPEKRSKRLQTFYKLYRYGEKIQWVPVEAEAIKIEGYDCFIVKEGTWNISLAEIGIIIAKKDIKKDAINFARNFLNGTSKENIETMLKSAKETVIKTAGENPLFNEEVSS